MSLNLNSWIKLRQLERVQTLGKADFAKVTSPHTQGKHQTKRKINVIENNTLCLFLSASVVWLPKDYVFWLSSLYQRAAPIPYSQLSLKLHPKIFLRKHASTLDKLQTVLSATLASAFVQTSISSSHNLSNIQKKMNSRPVFRLPTQKNKVTLIQQQR